MTVGHGYRPGLALVWPAGVLVVPVGVVPASTWLLQVPAWAFATLFVAGFTGLVRRNA